jgi:putative flippase GtrA
MPRLASRAQREHREGNTPMKALPRTAAEKAAAPLNGGPIRFAAVGLSGVFANLAALHLFAAVIGIREVVASALAIEASIVWNFLLHDGFTFRDRREDARAGVLGRLARYHAVSALGALVQLATFTVAVLALAQATGRSDAGPLRYAAQATGIAVAFLWNFGGSNRFAWATRSVAAAPLAPIPEPAPRRAALVPRAMFFALLAAHVLPIWLVAYFPTQDGPLHVENVLALLRHSGSPLLQRWYEVNWGVQPNWLTQALLAGALTVVSPVTAEKAILTGYTLLFPLAFRTVLPRGTRGWWAALAAFPFVHAYPFHMGFWNFCYGFALAFLAAGFFLRTRGRLTPLRFAALAVLAVLLFLAHVVAFAGAALAMGTALLWRAALSWSRARESPSRRRAIVRGYGRRAAVALVAAAPGLVLAGAWLGQHRDHVASRIPLGELAAKLAVGYSLVSIDRRELLLSASLMLALFVAFVHLLLARAGRGPRLRPHDGWLLASLAFVLLYFAVPDVVAAGAHVSDRFSWFALVALVAWIGTGTAPMASLRRVSTALALLAVVALGVRLEKQRDLSALLAEFVSAKEVIEEGRVLLPLALSPHGPRDEAGRRLGYRVKPFLHAAGWIVAERGGVDLKNSQANTDHCPVRFPPEKNPFRTIAGSLGRMEGMPPCVDLGAAARASTDYVLVWGATREELRTPCGGALVAALAAGFEPVFLSQPHGFIEVWRPRTRTASR